MNEEPKKWLTIIPPMPEAEFDTFLKRWRDENESTLEGIDASRFVVDVLRTIEGKSHRRLRMELK